MVVTHKISQLNAGDPAILLVALSHSLHLAKFKDMQSQTTHMCLFCAGSGNHVGELGQRIRTRICIVVSVVGDTGGAFPGTRHLPPPWRPLPVPLYIR
jgi:hypothetical protein